MSPAHRAFLKWARHIHVYLTMFGLLLLLFFALTGFMLNHEDWFGVDKPFTQTIEGKLPADLVGGQSKEPDKLAIAELLRRDFAATGLVDAFEIEEDRIRVVFKAPSRFAEAVINRDDGATTVNRESRGFANLLMDLHRGKSSGFWWSLLIDAVCVMLVVISATGLILWSSLRGRAKHGFAVLVAGTLFGLATYWWGVP
jgi:hypothetical protein